MRRLLVLCTAVILSACASLAPVRDANDVNDRVAFSMDARFSVQYSDNNEDKNLTGKMQWEETQRATDIVFATPIGTSMANLHVTRNESVLKTADGGMYVEKTPEELLNRMLGYELPLSYLRQAIGSVNTPLPEGGVFLFSPSIRQITSPTFNTPLPPNSRLYEAWRIQVLDRFTNPNLAKKLLITRQVPTPITMTVFIDERSDAPNE